MPQSTELRFLDPELVRLYRERGDLVLSLGNRTFENVTLVRAFPLSDPDRFWGLLDSDGKDIGVIAEPGGLDAESHAVALEQLQNRYFIPVIEQVVRTHEEFGTIVWTVVTDKGERTFTVRNMKDSIVELGHTRLLLVDVEGNRYEIPDTRRLDPKSFDLILRSQ